VIKKEKPIAIKRKVMDCMLYGLNINENGEWYFDGIVN